MVIGHIAAWSRGKLTVLRNISKTILALGVPDWQSETHWGTPFLLELKPFFGELHFLQN